RTTLDRQFTNPAEGNAYLNFLRTEVEAGTRIWMIEDRAGALTTAAAILADEAALIDSINTTLDTAEAARTTNPAVQAVRDDRAAADLDRADRIGQAIRATQQPATAWNADTRNRLVQAAKQHNQPRD